jgi:hypothetical protein
MSPFPARSARALTRPSGTLSRNAGEGISPLYPLARIAGEGGSRSETGEGRAQRGDG